VASGKYVRFRSPENIIKEIAFLHKAYPTQSRIYLEVESIALNKNWLKEFCNKLVAFNTSIGNFISYDCNFRISSQAADKNIFLALKNANFYKINIGLESGSERIRKEILKRDYTNKDFEHVIAMAREAGLKICTYNMIGIPGETYEDYMETVLLNRHCKADYNYTGIFFPYPGTKLYEKCAQEKLIKTSIDIRLERRHPVIESKIFSRHQIYKAYILFNYRVYKWYKPHWWIIMQTFMSIVRSNVTFRFLYSKVVRSSIYYYIQGKIAAGRRNKKG
jgi:radical SAM superfamily enzyme YgiQ (UPF0313 family)